MVSCHFKLYNRLFPKRVDSPKVCLRCGLPGEFHNAENVLYGKCTEDGTEILRRRRELVRLPWFVFRVAQGGGRPWSGVVPVLGPIETRMRMIIEKAFGKPLRDLPEDVFWKTLYERSSVGVLHVALVLDLFFGSSGSGGL